MIKNKFPDILDEINDTLSSLVVMKMLHRAKKCQETYI